MAKTRVSQHSGRNGSAKHNDRSFWSDWSDQKRKELAGHIRFDDEETHCNLYWTWNQERNFAKAEKEYYEKAFGKGLEETNKKYIKSRHPERCRTIEDKLKSKQYCPEEIIIQIGNKESHIDPDTFIQCVNKYFKGLNNWSKNHGNAFQILDMALHFDETSPHCHIRRVWQYQDKEGLTRIGQDKALERAGVDLPDPWKKKGRYNNRKMKFDEMTREFLKDIGRKAGYDIEEVPRANIRHKNKKDYINDQISKENAKMEELSCPEQER